MEKQRDTKKEKNNKLSKITCDKLLKEFKHFNMKSLVNSDVNTERIVSTRIIKQFKLQFSMF